MDYQNLIRQAVVLWVALCMVLLPIYLALKIKLRLQGAHRWHLIIPLFLFYLCGVVAFTFLPLPETEEFTCNGSLYYPRFFLGWSLELALRDNGGNLIQALTSRYILQVLLNILLFIPLGLFLNRYLQMRFRTATLVAFGCTLLIELTQVTGLWGYYSCAYRTFDVEDILANTTGALLGWIFVEVWRLSTNDELPNL